MGDFDQRTLARLWELENGQMQDRRAELEGERFLSLFLEKLDGRSFIFRHGLDESTEGASVADAEYHMYETPREAEIVYERMLEEARQAGLLVDDESLDDLGDPYVDGPVTTEVGRENLENT